MPRTSLRSPRELAGRGLQVLRIAQERLHLAPGGGAPDGGNLRPTLPFPLPDRATISAAYARSPEERNELLAHADAALGGQFHLLGFRNLEFGFPPDWHTDPTRGLRAPLAHWSKVPYLDASVVGDHKIVWEVNRHQWLVTLAQASALTGDPRYASGISQTLEDWLAANPPRQGVNWVSSLELAFRAIAWTWTLHILGGRLPSGDRLIAPLLGSLDLHGRQIERFLSTWFSPNTHLTGEALGLLYLGVAWPILPRAAHWRRLGWRILVEQLPIQVREDGTYFEQATWYQGYTTDFYLHALVLARAAGLTVPAALPARVGQCAGVLAELVRPDGSIPLMGDDDGGRLLPLDPRRPCFQDTLALAAHVLNRPGFCSSGLVPAGTVWTIGKPARATMHVEPSPLSDPQSVAFEAGGAYILRGPEGAMVCDAGPHGVLAGGHSHADSLAFDLTVAGRGVLVDPGTGAYVAPWRDRFRATDVHNTLSLADRSGSAAPAGAFGWGAWPRTTVRAWRSGQGWAVLQAEHDGFGRVVPGLVHRRSVIYHNGLGWLVIDQLIGSSQAAQVIFQVNEGLTTRQDGQTVAVQDKARELLQVIADGIGAIEVGSGLVSKCYGWAEDAPRIARLLAADDAAGGVATALATDPGVRLGRAVADQAVEWTWTGADARVTARLEANGALVLQGDVLNLRLD